MESLFRLHYAAVVAYVRRRASSDCVDDVVAETFLVTWRRLERVPEPALPWLLGVARNVLLTQNRGSRRRGALRSRLKSAGVEVADAPSVEERGPVAIALDRLSEKDREALTLIAWDGLAPSEAALMLGDSANTFRVRVYRAKRRLKRLLEDEFSEPAMELSTPTLLEAERSTQ
jgi:RNA polymerase sigma-70 factor (ECF subfamily)